MQEIKTIIDLGNWFIKTLVLWKEEDETTTIRKDIMITKGLRKGKMLDKDSLCECIKDITERCQKKLWGDYVDEYIIWISHPEGIMKRIQEQKRVMNEKISQEDVQHLSNVIADISQKDWYETLKIIPIHWIIDEKKKEKDPIGLQAKKLDMVADIFQVPMTFYNWLIEIIDRLWLYVTDIVPNILATAEATLDYDMKDLGTVTVDIGKNQTSYVIYEEWYPLFYETLPIWGENITKDISIGMQIDIAEAEWLKINHGQLLQNEEGQIQEQEGIDAHFLANIITARYEEIFEKIQKKLVSLDKDWRLAWWVILSWWGSKMKHVENLAKRIFKVATFLATDKNRVTKDLSNNVQFINTLGLYERSEKFSGTKRTSFNLWLQKDIFKKITQFIRNLF